MVYLEKLVSKRELRDYFENVFVDIRIILKCILDKAYTSTWVLTGFLWLKSGTGG
jgi:hypothetical protein